LWHLRKNVTEKLTTTSREGGGSLTPPDLLRFYMGSLMRYHQQLNLNFKPRDATPQEVEDWYNTELKWWGERQLKFVAIATVVQISALGMMGLVMLINQWAFS